MTDFLNWEAEGTAQHREEQGGTEQQLEDKGSVFLRSWRNVQVGDQLLNKRKEQKEEEVLSKQEEHLEIEEEEFAEEEREEEQEEEIVGEEEEEGEEKESLNRLTHSMPT